jgi:hypothetical protein
MTTIDTTTSTFDPGPFSLENFKSYPTMSEETLAFEANIWVAFNPERPKGLDCVGYVRNSGHGGCAEVHWTDADARDLFEKHLASLAPEPSKWGGEALGWNEDFFFSEMAERMAFEKRLSRLRKGNVVFRLASDPADQFRTSRYKGVRTLTDEQRESITTALLAEHPDAVIL